MKTTIIKLFCLFLVTLISFDSYAQRLKPPSQSGNDGDARCWSAEDGTVTYCTPFTLPVDLLTFDYTSTDECLPVNNFGCDLHIGLTNEESGETTYVQITSCIVDQINASESWIPSGPNDPSQPQYPSICIQFPFSQLKRAGCVLQLSMDLYCKDETGGFTPIAEEFDDISINYSLILPETNDTKTLVQKYSYESSFCCDLTPPDHLDPTYGDLAPFTSQSGNGSMIFISNLPTNGDFDISLFNAKYEEVDIRASLTKLSDTEYSIDISNEKAGVYFVRINNSLTIYSKTVIKP